MGPKWEKFTQENNQLLILDNPTANLVEMRTIPVSKDDLLSQIEADSALEIKERCLIGWIAAQNFQEDARPCIFLKILSSYPANKTPFFDF